MSSTRTSKKRTAKSGAGAAPTRARAPKSGDRSGPSLLWPLAALAAGAVGSWMVLGACGKAGEPPQPSRTAGSAEAPGAAAEPLASATETQGLLDPSDGGGNNLIAIPDDAFVDEPAPADPKDVVLLGAMNFMTNVWERPDYSSKRIGYLRAGAKVPLKHAVPGQAVARTRTPSCKEGWVEIAPRGWVCLEKGGGSLNLEAPNVRLATAPPNFDELLPYKYGFVWRNGTPLYRKVPNPKQWVEYEPWLKPKPKPKPEPEKKKSDDEDPYETASTGSGSGSDVDLLDAGTSTAKAVASSQADVLDAGALGDDAMPWWQQDGGKASISLKDTMESEGIVARRMAKGFAISIDRTFVWHNRTWYRTTMGLVAPADAVTLRKSPEFRGVELGDEWQLPIAWAMIKEAGIYETKDEKSFAIKDRFKKRTPIRLLPPTDPKYKEIKSGQHTYVPTFDGRWIRTNDVNRAEPAEPPAGLKPGEKWIDVAIKQETLVLYEGDKPVFATLMSAGKDGTNVKGSNATVQGTFRVREKHVAATMDGDTSGELYSIDDVPYILYFHASYAVHGAFWHEEFGRVRSHGCVNLSPPDAKRVFFWSDPPVPQGWHAVWSDAEHPGTIVVSRP